MNKEFMYLDSSELAVTDQNGVITKRKAVGNDKEILETENKVEVINNAIDEFNKSLTKEKTI